MEICEGIIFLWKKLPPIIVPQITFAINAKKMPATHRKVNNNGTV